MSDGVTVAAQVDVPERLHATRQHARTHVVKDKQGPSMNPGAGEPTAPGSKYAVTGEVTCLLRSPIASNPASVTACNPVTSTPYKCALQTVAGLLLVWTADIWLGCFSASHTLLCVSSTASLRPSGVSRRLMLRSTATMTISSSFLGWSRTSFTSSSLAATHRAVADTFCRTEHGSTCLVG